MGDSRTFGEKIPYKRHLNQGSGGVQYEITKLRLEIDSSFFGLEQSGQLALYRADTIDPTVNDDITRGFTVFSRWINASSPAKEFVCLDPTPGAAYWQETTSVGSGGGAVDSVFGRAGNVLAASGDYEASQITNDSGVTGITVADALDNLFAAIPPTAPVSSVFGRTGAILALSGDYTSSQITNASTVPGSSVTAALNSLLSTRALASRNLIAGAGLTGGGDLSADRTFNIGANIDGSIVVNADDVQVGVLATDAQHGNRGGGGLHDTANAFANGFMSFLDKVKLDGIEAGAEVNDVFSVFGRVGAVVATSGDYAASLVSNDSSITGATVKDALDNLVPTTRQVIAGTGLTGGGALSANITLNVIGNADGSIVANANDIQVGILATDAQHGVRGGGTQHALVNGSSAGFMSASDFTKLAGVEAGAEVNDVFSVFGRVGAVVATLSDYAASLVTNDSSVIGATVKDALDSLMSGGSGSHRTLRELIHFISEGPAGGFTSGAYRENLPVSPFPTSLIWWTDSGKTEKIVELTITRDSQQRPTIKLWQMYDTDGVTVTETVSDAITYSGTTPFELYRTRTIT